MNVCNNSNIFMKDKVLINLHHVKQKYTWDCGISCIMMVLDEATKNYFVDNFVTVCKEEGFEESTWTIDLAYLLCRFGIKHLYKTITIGVHPDLSSESFYRNVLNKDQQRVVNRFKFSANNNIMVEKGSVVIFEIISHLSNGGPVIVLVNANLLICDLCHRNGYELKSCLSCTSSPPYQGHYIVLVGFNYSLGKIFYRNPGFKDRICSFGFSAFDKARKSFGTDEDIIFIFND
ncbi:Protein GUCD1 [Armadillidium nasatum]|uniref:Protein GUCD1 n=1 Tax=Armadillidium nasatum TaxID=96803 RepID=A0A5N5TL65_9CRUS|nr:Protein GUCD1 [Armadillidium nasatum]